jgi:excisionase family DNA binding protein
MSIASFDLGSDTAVQRELYAPREIERILGVSHAQLYKLLAAGRLVAVKNGRSTRITRGSLEQFLAQLPAAKFRAA